jgi:hypothetical protein
MDVATAFLNGELEEELYLEQPQSFIVPGKEDWEIFKCFYGLKQFSRTWIKKFDVPSGVPPCRQSG